MPRNQVELVRVHPMIHPEPGFPQQSPFGPTDRLAVEYCLLNRFHARPESAKSRRRRWDEGAPRGPGDTPHGYAIARLCKFNLKASMRKQGQPGPRHNEVVNQVRPRMM